MNLMLIQHRLEIEHGLNLLEVFHLRCLHHLNGKRLGQTVSLPKRDKDAHSRLNRIFQLRRDTVII